jgi:hypothetical protein
MSGSQAGPSASGAAIAFGIALLFATGAFGFYLLVGIVPSVSTPPSARPVVPSDEELESPAPVTPGHPIVQFGADPGPMAPADLLELIPVPMTMTGALPDH